MDHLNCFGAKCIQWISELYEPKIKQNWKRLEFATVMTCSNILQINILIIGCFKVRRKDEQKKIWLKQSLCLKSEDTNCALCVSVLFYCYFRSHLLIHTECAALALIRTFRFQVIKTQNDLKILLKSLKEQKKKKACLHL